LQGEIFVDTHELEHLATWSLEIKLRIGHIELLDAESENCLFYLLGVIGLTGRLPSKSGSHPERCSGRQSRSGRHSIESGPLVGSCSGFAAQDIAIKSTNPDLF
jgi:hypothetical protein